MTSPRSTSPKPTTAGYQRILLGVVMLAVMTFGSLMTIVTVSLDLIADRRRLVRAPP